MTRLRLTEYRTLEGVDFSSEQIRAIQALDPTPLSLTPNHVNPSLTDLTAGSLVGVVHTSGLDIEIHPKLTIDRLLFLLSFTMDPKNWPDVHSEFEQRDSLLEAIIPGFVFQVRRTLRNGVLQGYRTEEDALITVRGRIRISEQIRRRYGLAPPIELQFDEFTEDIPENQLLKAAIHRLSKLPIRSQRIRQLLRGFDLALQHVSLVEFTPQMIPDINWTRLNERYRPAVELARLILRATSFDLGAGRVAASAFLVNMNAVFESFVVVSLGDALKKRGMRLVRQDARLRLDERRQISLEPDLSCWAGGRCLFVGDVKYKRTEDNRGKNADLYQLLAYTVAADLRGGLLIYAKGEEEPRHHDVVHIGRTLRVEALDLEVSPAGILRQIDGIAGFVQRSAQREAVTF